MPLLETIVGRGTTAAKPAASADNEGYLYFDTDLDKLQRSNGTSWEDVERADPAGGGSGWTFVSVAPIEVLNASTSATLSAQTTATLSTLPAGALAVQAWARITSTATPNAANSIFIRHYDTTDSAFAVYSPPTANYFNAAAGTVVLGGDRQFKYEVNRFGGTVAYLVWVTGYWIAS